MCEYRHVHIILNHNITDLKYSLTIAPFYIPTETANSVFFIANEKAGGDMIQNAIINYIFFSSKRAFCHLNLSSSISKTDGAQIFKEIVVFCTLPPNDS